MKHIIEIETAEPIREMMKPVLYLLISESFYRVDAHSVSVKLHLNDEPSALQSSHAEVVTALESLLDDAPGCCCMNQSDDCCSTGRAHRALANAAKLAPTRCTTTRTRSA